MHERVRELVQKAYADSRTVALRDLRNQWLALRIPIHSDHRFRFIPITGSDGFRSVIPIDSDHLGVSE